MSDVTTLHQPVQQQDVASDQQVQPTHSALGAMALRFLRSAAGGFGLWSFVQHRRARRFKVEEIAVYTVHRSFFLWALILTGFVASAAVRHHGSPIVWGWVYAVVLLYTFIMLLFDVSSLKFALWGGIIGFVWLALRYLEDLKHWTVLSHLSHYLGGLHPRLDAGFATLVSWVLLIPWVMALCHSFGRGRKVFSPNSIEEWFIGEGREITDRSGLKFRSRYRDLFESLLGLGCGDLEATDGNGNVVKRYENILFLWWHWRRLDEILHQRSAVVDNAPEDPVEVETIRR